MASVRRAAWTGSIWACSMDLQHGPAAWTMPAEPPWRCPLPLDVGADVEDRDLVCFY